MIDDLAAADYSALATFHAQLRRTTQSTTAQTRQAGLQPPTFMLLLALRQQPPGVPATIGELVNSLQWNRSEVVELLDDLVQRGFVARTRDKSDRRRFLISLTPVGAQWLTPLAKGVLQELAQFGPELLRSVRLALTHAAANEARRQPAVRPEIDSFAWRAVGTQPI